MGAAGAAELADGAGSARDQIVGGASGYAASTVSNAIEDAWDEASDWFCDNVDWPFC